MIFGMKMRLCEPYKLNDSNYDNKLTVKPTMNVVEKSSFRPVVDRIIHYFLLLFLIFWKWEFWPYRFFFEKKKIILVVFSYHDRDFMIVDRKK